MHFKSFISCAIVGQAAMVTAQSQASAGYVGAAAAAATAAAPNVSGVVAAGVAGATSVAAQASPAVMQTSTTSSASASASFDDDNHSAGDNTACHLHGTNWHCPPGVSTPTTLPGAAPTLGSSASATPPAMTSGRMVPYVSTTTSGSSSSISASASSSPSGSAGTQRSASLTAVFYVASLVGAVVVGALAF